MYEDASVKTKKTHTRVCCRAKQFKGKRRGRKQTKQPRRADYNTKRTFEPALRVHTSFISAYFFIPPSAMTRCSVSAGPRLLSSASYVTYRPNVGKIKKKGKKKVFIQARPKHKKLKIDLSDGGSGGRCTRPECLKKRSSETKLAVRRHQRKHRAFIRKKRKKNHSSMTKHKKMD